MELRGGYRDVVSNVFRGRWRVTGFPQSWKFHALPRLGALRTLDLKGNELRVSLVVLIVMSLWTDLGDAIGY